MIKKCFYVLNLTVCIFFISNNILAQRIVKGTVTDAKSGETLIGCSIYIPNTNIGTTSDLDGNFELKNVPTGEITLVASYVSYNNKEVKVKVPNDGTVIVNFELMPATIEISEVKVVARKRQNTDLAMISSIKSQDLIVSGISNQQIQKSVDRDAAEVVRRIPGITLNSGRFIVVRGLMERYNSVLLNGSVAPSSEADVRAFSFDLLPSNLIDNIFIYKTPAPELPADFAGAAININTKNVIDENSTSFSYSIGYTQNTTFENFYTYKGGKLDWLGIDDGTRKLPSVFPSKNQMNDSIFRYDYLPAYQDSITKISRSFNNEGFIPYQTTAKPNQSASITLNRTFALGNIKVSNISSIIYSQSSSTYNALRADYLDPNAITGDPSYLYNFTDKRYNFSVRSGIVHNWAFSWSNRHKIEVRNFFNINSSDRTVIRDGIRYESSELDTIRAYSMEFNQRTTYLGQIAGTSNFNNENTQIEWLYGFSYANKYQPDMKKLYMNKLLTNDNIYQYRLSFTSLVPVPERGGRFYMNSDEYIHNWTIHLKQNFNWLSREFTLKTGLSYEIRERIFDARNIGIITKGFTSIDLFQPIDSVLQNKNFYYPGGLAYNENSKPTNHYRVDNRIFSPYVGLKFPIIQKLNLYTGVRIENYYRLLADFQKNKELTPDITFKSTDIFSSVNLSYSFTENNILRFSYGKTVNRPEFREVSQFYYTDFDLNAGVWGNDSLRNNYIDNFDLRYEIYPSQAEMITFALFYKKFSDPIEISLIETGNQPEYKPFNTKEGYSAGIELDMRKSFNKLGDYDNFLKYLKNITLVMNIALIQSRVNTDLPDTREKEREMMGQSPYIINVGAFYISEKHKFQFNVLYNKIGRRLVFIGTKNFPHTWELGRNLVDLTIVKEIGRGLEFKFGIKDLLNEPVTQLQYETVTLVSSQQKLNLEQITTRYKPGTQYSLSISYKF